MLLFAKNPGALKAEITLPEAHDESLTYYVAGVEKGEWTVYLDGKPTEKAVAEEGYGIISFKVKKGKISLKSS